MKRHIYRGLAWMLVWTMTATTIAPYATAEPGTQLQDALQLYEELEWERAIAKFLDALDAGLDPDDRAKAYWYLAILSYAYDNLQETEDYMYKAFRAKPSFEPPEPVRGATLEKVFNRASARIDKTPPQVKILSAKESRHNQPIRVIVEISDDSPIVEVNLSYQLPDANRETVMPMMQETANRWLREIPKAATKTPGEFSFHVSCQDEWQNISTEPATVVIFKDGGGRGILYLIGGAIVAIGGGVAALVLGASDDDTPPPSVDTPGGTQWPKSASPLPPR